jgi:hypothetical protein
MRAGTEEKQGSIHGIPQPPATVGGLAHSNHAFPIALSKPMVEHMQFRF